MNSNKIITFQIDPNLDKIWNAIGLSQIEKAEESKKLELVLIKSYQQFISDTNYNLEDLKNELINSYNNLENIKNVFGDETEIPIFENNLPIKEQIRIIKENIELINKKYQTRINKFNDLFKEINFFHEKLKIPINERGDFNLIGSKDLTNQRLIKYEEYHSKIENEINQRNKLFLSYK